MPTPVSKVLGVSHGKLLGLGVFDGFVDVDSRLHVDPHLLQGSAVAELRGSYDRFQKHFERVMQVLQAARGRHPAFRREAVHMLTFREIPNTGLGYSRGDTRGSAIGPVLANQLVDLASDIIDAGIEDPTIFELVGLLQEGMGADRISDMAVSIILPDLLEYTERIARELDIRTDQRAIRGKSYNLPFNPADRRPLILLPQAILRHLPVAESWEDIDTVASHNSELRRRVNPIIGSTWRSATGRRVSKADLRATLLQHPELLRELLEQYKRKPTRPYDFSADPAGQQVWYYSSQEEANNAPLDLAAFTPVTLENVVQVVRLICEKYRTLVEDNRLYRVLYNDDGSVRHERIAQLGFFAIASTYCDANRLDLSPEVNSGPGPVDFKLSHGQDAKVNVEVKLSSNQRLVHGFEVQLPLYDRAERAGSSFLLIIRVDESTARIERVRQLATQARQEGKRVPAILVIDGRRSPPASKA